MKSRITTKLTKQQQQALNDEVRRQLSEMSKDWYNNIDALILYTLNTEFGFGRKRLLAFYKALRKANNNLIRYYRMDDPEFICKTKLKNIGVDIDQWNENISKGRDIVL